MKFKRGIIVLLSSVFLMTNASLLLGDGLPEVVRVGLEYKYKNASTVPINNEVIQVGSEINGVFISQATLTADSSFTVTIPQKYYIDTTDIYLSYEQAAESVAIFQSSNIPAVAVYSDVNYWRVYTGGYGTLAEAETALGDKRGKIVPPNDHQMVLTDGTMDKIIFDSETVNPQISGVNGDFMSLGDRSYRGVIEFNRNLGNSITAINVLPTDQYLYAVVPSEMPAVWPIEALKAQSVAARNYTATRAGIHSEEGYDLCDGVHCQAYVGAGNESPSSTQAVDQTSGDMIYYEDEIIGAVYFSSSGGTTEDSANVWQEQLPYLTSVKEINENGYKQWTRTFTLDELTNLCTANSVNIGQVTGMSAVYSPTSGRVSQLIISGTDGNKVLEKTAIRTFFSSAKGGSLESNNFTISGGKSAPVSFSVPLSGSIYVDNIASVSQYAIEEMYVIGGGGETIKLTDPVATGNTSPVNNPAPSADTNTVVITGKGYGHGVGMSQYGAKGMAEQGYTYDEILEYYYTGAEVR